MHEIGNSLFLILTSKYSDLSGVDKTIADYFLTNTDDEDLSADHISKKLHVSLASISRFAQKLGYPGYREFKYAYDNFKGATIATDEVHHAVFKNYQRILSNNYNSMSRTQLERIAKYLVQYEKVFVYGIGSSGMSANEMKIRFMRLGINIQAISDVHTLKMNKALVDESALVIGISLSASADIVRAVQDASQKNAKTIMITSNDTMALECFCDEVIKVAVIEDMDIGNAISPQFPILLVIDVLYAYIMNSDDARYKLIMRQTLSKSRTLE